MLALRKRVEKARLTCLETSSEHQTPHIGSALSCLDLLVAVYQHECQNKISWDNPSSYPTVLLSKGHAALAQYAVLAEFGAFDRDELVQNYCIDGSRFQGHISKMVPGISFSTGSLGHALPHAVGLAIGYQKTSPKKAVWAVLSDGELDEGSNWEAFLIAAHLKLPNLNVIVDRNFLQSFDSTEETIKLEPLHSKLKAFGWDVNAVDGHNLEEIVAWVRAGNVSLGPRCLIAKTTKGNGVPRMEGNNQFHYRPATYEDVCFQVAKIEQSDMEDGSIA